jgi:CheY-like chemotaxis protein
VRSGDATLARELKPGAYIHVAVEDNGQGIPPEVIKRIFDPFFTTKEVGKGTGLGLSTVLGILKSHSGLVTVDSEPGRGTRFNLYLPAEEGAAETAGVADGPAPRLGRSQTILLVDDEPAVGAATRLWLEGNGYQVIMAANGREAVARFLENQDGIKLVLTDLMMPVMGGIPLITALKGIGRKLRFVAITGLRDEGKLKELAALGVMAVLEKPCNPRDLLRAISEQLAAAD